MVKRKNTIEDWKLWRTTNLILTGNIEFKSDREKHQETYLMLVQIDGGRETGSDGEKKTLL